MAKPFVYSRLTPQDVLEHAHRYFRGLSNRYHRMTDGFDALYSEQSKIAMLKKIDAVSPCKVRGFVESCLKTNLPLRKAYVRHVKEQAPDNLYEVLYRVVYLGRQEGTRCPESEELRCPLVQKIRGLAKEQDNMPDLGAVLMMSEFVRGRLDLIIYWDLYLLEKQRLDLDGRSHTKAELELGALAQYVDQKYTLSDKFKLGELIGDSLTHLYIYVMKDGEDGMMRSAFTYSFHYNIRYTRHGLVQADLHGTRGAARTDAKTYPVVRLRHPSAPVNLV